MEILVIGSEVNLQECRQKFGKSHQYKIGDGYIQAKEFLKSEVIFDFAANRNHLPVQVYQNYQGIVFLDTSRISLAKVLGETQMKATFFGFCGLPTFLNRDIFETSLPKKTDQKRLEEICSKLDTKFAMVKDQVGLITPRVICMIINEAYFSVQENIASRKDIDLAMRLGTNYPFGPFEWCERIGVKNVYELLKAVHEATKDERYRVCELLKEDALR